MVRFHGGKTDESGPTGRSCCACEISRKSLPTPSLSGNPAVFCDDARWQQHARHSTSARPSVLDLILEFLFALCWLGVFVVQGPFDKRDLSTAIYKNNRLLLRAISTGPASNLHSGLD
jgi:hypothetical protein